MKLYIFYPLGRNIKAGPNIKVISQCNQLSKTGSEVVLFLVGGRESGDLDIGFSKKIKFIEMSSCKRSNIIFRIRYQWELRNILINLIESASSSDIIYLRYPNPLFYMLWPFSKQVRMCKIVNEHNTIEDKEFRLAGSYLFLCVDFFLGRLLRQKADGIVGVTDEITAHEVTRSGDPKKPHITIGNGIEVNKVKLRNPSDLFIQEIKLLCVASFSRWHGIDRLLRGLALYKGGTKVHLYIVGDGKELANLRLIVKDLKLDDTVIFTGFISGRSLDDLFDKSHIAIGSLGLHRMEMKEGSILKAREYCARGIPFLYGCSDPDFPDGFPYIQKVPGDESPINVEEIIRFAEKVHSDPEHHIKMRAYAEKRLDWSVKMKNLKEFCETLVEG